MATITEAMTYPTSPLAQVSGLRGDPITGDRYWSKAFAAREQDWTDIKGVIIRQKNTISWEYVHKQHEPLCMAKESPEIMRHLDEIRRNSL